MSAQKADTRGSSQTLAKNYDHDATQKMDHRILALRQQGEDRDVARARESSAPKLSDVCPDISYAVDRSANG